LGYSWNTRKTKKEKLYSRAGRRKEIDEKEPNSR
jgi:hypothetical protein